MMDIASGLASASTLLSKANAASNIVDAGAINEAQKLSYEQAKKRQLLAQKQAQIKEQAQQKQRKNLLKKQLAKQRASFSSSGIGNYGGSSKAVKDAMVKDYENNLAYDQAVSEINQEKINNSYFSSQKPSAISQIGGLTGSLSDNIKTLIS